MIFAIDFDGTLVEDNYPSIGKPRTEVIKYVKALKKRGHELILYTCRNKTALDEAVTWCNEQGLKFDAINENLDRVKALYGGDTRKVYADYYLDDKAISINEFERFVECGKHLLSTKF